MSAPERPRLPDFAGRPVSLPDAPDAWELLNPGGNHRDVLLLGLGPGNPQELPFVRAAAERGGTVFWVEDGRTLGRLRPAGFAPPGWRRLTPGEAARLSGAAVHLYRPSLRLAPDFWGPIAGRIEAKATALPGAPAPTVWLPGDETQLLHRELRTALEEAGFSPFCGPAPRGAAELPDAWGGRLPAFALSVNLRGMDAEGRVFHACRALGVPVALWFVDNPWHVLPAARLPWWREAHLFVTDASFIPGLTEYGATSVHHLPLAVAPHMWRPLPDETEAGHLARLAPRFVGRAAFPGRERFFAAARVPGELLARALALTRESAAPSRLANFHWWAQRLHVRLWPGHEVRAAGLGAERCAQANRSRWIAAGLPLGLRVTGDALWRELVPGCEPEAPVDYYGSLPEVYRQASAVLNVTSLLLPASLSQRHFDVWAAGGLLLTDATKGLDIFPHELTAPITLTSRAELGPRVASLAANSQHARDLRQAWREHLRAAHTYGHRLAFIREKIGA
ncbi:MULTISPECIES: glycosyltransferase [unclassified Desulfovibrio]|uniref:glycosyltransferase family protein n=1 Tax=unclassified Desulfovibrio TaxID=2593640 RepID=UPI0013EC867A|nr:MULTISPECIES: glycosyltransferase [unclassified Desulfovibrio]